MEKYKYGYTKAEYKKFNIHAWKYLILFSVLYCAHYCTRLNIGYAQIQMTEFSSADIGIITSVLFWTYAVGHLVNGRLGEIFGVRRFIIWSVILSIAANFVMGFQSSVWLMAVVWGVNGFVQSMAWSPGVASLTAWWPGDKRGMATGFANALTGFGQVIVALMVALGFAWFPQLGWRSAFYVPAIFPIVMLIIYMIFAKCSPKDVGLKEYEENDVGKADHELEMENIVKEKGVLYPYFHLLKNKVFLVWCFVAFASGLARYGLATWIPKYLKEVHSLDNTAALLTSTILPIGMGIGTLIVPWLTDKYCPKNRLIASIISGVATVLCIVGFIFLKAEGFQLFLMMVCMFFAGFFIYAINGTIWTFAADVGGRVFSSTASGILDFAAYMGAAIQSVVYGFILTKGDWNTVFISTAVFCFMIAVISLITSVKKKAR